ncbi:hypothetical protein FAI40_04605 [Acetobacteraceae bacterium]|nr:hypothetical protein FAI40_04605 [Acetobacteraceae bacterium]
MRQRIPTYWPQSGVVALSLALMGLSAATVVSTGITLFGQGKRFKAFLRGKKGAGLAEEALEEGAEELFEGKGKAPAEAAKSAPKAPNTSTNVASKAAQVAEKAEEELKTGGNLAKKAAITGIKKRGGWSLLRVLGNVAKSPATRRVLFNVAKTGGSLVGRGIAADGLLTVLGGTAGAGTIAEFGLGALLAPELALPIAAGAATYGAWKWWNNRQAEHAKQAEAAKKAAEINLNAPPLLPGMQAPPQNVAEFYRQAENGQNEKAQIAAQKNAFFQKSMLLEKERALGPLTEIRTGDIIINDAHTDDPLAFAHEVEQIITQALNRTSNIFNPNIAI